MEEQLHIVWVSHGNKAVSGMLVRAKSKEEAIEAVREGYPPIPAKEVRYAGEYRPPPHSSKFFFTWTAPDGWIDFD